MLASNLALKARYRSHLRVSLPSFSPLNVVSELTEMTFFFFFFKIEIAKGKLLAIFLCKKQCCKQFYGTENFKYVSTFLLSKYKHSTYKSHFRYPCIFRSFPVLPESAALYLVKKTHWKKPFCNLYNICQIFKDSSTCFRTVFWHWNRARSYSSIKDLEIHSFLESSQQSACPQAKHAIKHYSRQSKYICTENAVWLHIGPRGNNRTTYTIPGQHHVQRLLH